MLSMSGGMSWIMRLSPKSGLSPGTVNVDVQQIPYGTTIGRRLILVGGGSVLRLDRSDYSLVSRTTVTRWQRRAAKPAAPFLVPEVDIGMRPRNG